MGRMYIIVDSSTVVFLSLRRSLSSFFVKGRKLGGSIRVSSVFVNFRCVTVSSREREEVHRHRLLIIVNGFINNRSCRSTHRRRINIVG